LVSFQLFTKLICSFQHQFDGVNPGNANPFCGKGIFKVLYGLFASPLIALVVGFLFYGVLFKWAIFKKKAQSSTSRLLFSLCVFIMFWTIGFQMTTAKSITHLANYPTLVTTNYCLNPNDKLFGIIIGITVGLLFTVPFHFTVLPRLLKSTKPFYLSFGMFNKKVDVMNKGSVPLEKIRGSRSSSLRSVEGPEKEPEEDEQVQSVFRPLQVVAACFAALNHGGNDVGNCIGPLVTVYIMYSVSMAEWTGLYFTDFPSAPSGLEQPYGR
jgi:phosphate/sulfate permease